MNAVVEIHLNCTECSIVCGGCDYRGADECNLFDTALTYAGEGLEGYARCEECLDAEQHN